MPTIHSAAAAATSTRGAHAQHDITGDAWDGAWLLSLNGACAIHLHPVTGYRYRVGH